MKENLIQLDWKQLHQILFNASTKGDLETVRILSDDDFRSFKLSFKLACLFAIDENQSDIVHFIFNTFKHDFNQDVIFDFFKRAISAKNLELSKFFHNLLNVDNYLKPMRTFVIDDFIKNDKVSHLDFLITNKSSFSIFDLHISNDIYFRVAVVKNKNEIIKFLILHHGIERSEAIHNCIKKYNRSDITSLFSKLFFLIKLNEKLPNRNLKDKTKKI